MIDLEDELRSLLTEDAMEVQARVDAPPDLRRRVRGRQVRTVAGMLSTAVGIVVVLSAALIGGRILQRPLDGVIPASSTSASVGDTFSPGSPSWVATIAEGDTTSGHWTFGMGTLASGDATYFAYSAGDSSIVSLGYKGDALDPGDAGIRLFMYPQGILEGSGPKPVFGVVPTSTASVELRSADGSTTPVSVYDLPGDYSSQAKAFVIPAPSSGAISGTLVALDAQGNELGRVQIPDAQDPQSPSP
jgi:hypothetical protein